MLKQFVLECADPSLVTPCLKLIDSGVIDAAIDVVVDATKGKILINLKTVDEEVMKKAVSCFGG